MTDHGIELAGALIGFGLLMGLGAIGAAFGDGMDDPGGALLDECENVGGFGDENLHAPGGRQHQAPLPREIRNHAQTPEKSHGIRKQPSGWNGQRQWLHATTLGSDCGVSEVRS